MKDALLFVVLITFVWAGMILGISFLEAPLKFQAPNVSLGIGLGIGRLVFTALNRIEILFCLIALVLSFFLHLPLKAKIILSIVTLILIAQTFWLLPVLDQRAQVIISGGIPGAGSPHIFYIAGEIIKLVSLISLGYILLRRMIKNSSDQHPAK